MLRVWLLGFVLCLSACSKKEQTELMAHKTQFNADEQLLFNRGKLAYQATCTACHGDNPKVQGELGPDLFGSSQALLRAKVIFGTYPKGYVPKQKTDLMARETHLVDEIDALHFYINNI